MNTVTRTLALGLLPDSSFAQDPKLVALAEKIDGLDFTRYERRMLLENPDMTPTDVESARIDYKQFLFLAGASDEVFSPTHLGDQLWHAHLTYTFDYRLACQELFNEFVDHEPFEHEPLDHSDRDGEILDVAKLAANEKSRQLWLKAFGVNPIFAGKCCCKRRR